MNYSRSFIVRAQIGIESNGHGQYAKLYTMRQYKSHPWKCVSSLAKYNSSLSIPLRLVDGRTISWRSLSTTATTTKKKTRTRSEGSSRRPSQPLRIGNQDSSVRGRGRSGGPLENQDVNGGRWSRGIRNQSAPDARPFSLHQSASDVAGRRETISSTRDTFHNYPLYYSNDKGLLSFSFSIFLLFLSEGICLIVDVAFFSIVVWVERDVTFFRILIDRSISLFLSEYVIYYLFIKLLSLYAMFCPFDCLS